MCKENKTNDFIQQLAVFHHFGEYRGCNIQYACVVVLFKIVKDCPGREEITLQYGGGCDEEELFNKDVIFVFFAHKMYSHSFVKLRLNNVTWTILTMSLLHFWVWEYFRCAAVYGGCLLS